MTAISFEDNKPVPDDPRGTLVLVNAKVLTMDPAMPTANAVAIRGTRIAAVGDGAVATYQAAALTRTIDCQGLTLIPGLIDSHCHLFAQASAMRGLDCSPQAASSIAALQRLVRSQAGRTSPGRWVRGFGYDELSLPDARHPNRWDLDEAAPLHPVRLDHRSGHASVLNSPALELAGIDYSTPDPPEGVIDRDQSTGQPTGLVLEMSSYLRDRMGRTSGDSELKEGLTRLNESLLGYGVTSVQDAGPQNGHSRWQALAGLQQSGVLQFRITMMTGFPQLGELKDRGLGWGDSGTWLRLGHAKIMLTMTTGALYPDGDALRGMVAECHSRGFPVAVHAVEREAVEATALALAEVPPVRGNPQGARDRIEHCSECPGYLVNLVKASGAMVVTQPGFIYWNGDRYLERVPSSLLPHLYPVDSLRGTSVPVAFSSDAPVIDPNPWPGIYSSVTRFTREGRRLPAGDRSEASGQQISVMEALRMYTRSGAYSEGSGDQKGSITPGKLADLALLDADPTTNSQEGLKDIHSVLTVVGGRVVWNEGL